MKHLRGLCCGDFVFGLAYTDEVGEAITAEPVWQDALFAAIHCSPTRLFRSPHWWTTH